MRTAIVLDDEAGVRRVISLLLARHDWHVLQASTAEQTIGLVARHSGVELLVADVVLRSGSGADVARQLTEREPQLFCLVMSGYPTADLFARGQIPEGLLNATSRVWFIEKPLTPHRLQAALTELRQQRPGARSPVAGDSALAKPVPTGPESSTPRSRPVRMSCASVCNGLLRQQAYW